MSTEVLYKWLDGSRSAHGGTGGWRKGRWRSVRGELVPCWNGLHLCREQDLFRWIATSLWVAEYDGERIDQDDKIVVRRARVVERLAWDVRIGQLFAADCAERVLPLFEDLFPDDDRPRKAIEAARACARGEITAAWAAAEAAWAARAAAEDAEAARAAAEAAWAARAAAEAAEAAWAAAGAAWAAAEAAAGAAEREWQTARLLDYAHGRVT